MRREDELESRINYPEGNAPNGSQSDVSLALLAVAAKPCRLSK